MQFLIAVADARIAISEYNVFTYSSAFKNTLILSHASATEVTFIKLGNRTIEMCVFKHTINSNFPMHQASDDQAT